MGGARSPPTPPPAQATRSFDSDVVPARVLPPRNLQIAPLPVASDGRFAIAAAVVCPPSADGKFVSLLRLPLSSGGRTPMKNYMPKTMTNRQPRRRNAGAIAPLGSDVTGDVTRHIPSWVQTLLWGRAAGRCEFTGCNRPLWKSDVTQETRNIAEKAHIRAFSGEGPRADDPSWPELAVHDPANLLLLCHACHVTIDRVTGPERYTATRLRDMKQRHERRIEIVTAVAPGMASHVVTYGTFVGHHQALPTFADAAEALFPVRYPASQEVIALGTETGAERDDMPHFYRHERQQLAFQFDRQVRVPLERRLIEHVSIFALAPQPLLIELGTLLGDVAPADVYQRHREPATWSWPTEGMPSDFEMTESVSCGATAALVLSVSGTIALERITRVLGGDVTVWTVTVPSPHNDSVKSRETLTRFREGMRLLLDKIKARHGDHAQLHVFPALPVSLAVELGRIRMPKADMPWVLYDEQRTLGGFVHAFTLDDPLGDN